MSKAVVLLSGGLDSSVLLYQLQEQNRECITVGIFYGQKHASELASAYAVAQRAGAEYVPVDINEAMWTVFQGAESSQVGRQVEVPDGHYAEETMRTTIVPNRNMLLLSIAGALAVSRGADEVAYAAHAGDHFIYPDCRPEFISAAAAALFLGAGVVLNAPFRAMTKAGIVSLGQDLCVPFELTRSCYKTGVRHCGCCGTCVERREAFALAGVVDPTKYEDQTDFWKRAKAPAL